MYDEEKDSKLKLEQHINELEDLKRREEEMAQRAIEETQMKDEERQQLVSHFTLLTPSIYNGLFHWIEPCKVVCRGERVNRQF